MNTINSFTIIGCGTLGSAIAYSLVLRSLDSDINKIYLIDDDVLELKNLPYLFYVDHLHQKIHKPKVLVLKDILYGINPKLAIETIFKRYPINNDQINNSYTIDCRDTKESDNKCNMKAHVDGHWGSLILNTENNVANDVSRYTIKNSRYYSMIMANICVRVIMNDLSLNNSLYIIDLRKEKFYELSGCRKER